MSHSITLKQWNIEKYMTAGKLFKLSLIWNVAVLSSIIWLEVMKEYRNTIHSFIQQTWQIKIFCEGQDFQLKFVSSSLQIIEKVINVGKPLKLSKVLTIIGLF